MKCTIEPTEERPQRWVLLLDGSLYEWQDQEKRAYPLLNPYDPFLIASQITSNKVSFSNAVHFWKGILRRSPPNFVVFELLHDKISANYGCGRQCIMLSPKDGIVLILLPSKCCSQSRHSKSCFIQVKLQLKCRLSENYFKITHVF